MRSFFGSGRRPGMPVALGSVVEPVGFFVCDAVGMQAVAMASVQRLRSAGGSVFCLGAGIRGCALPARAVWLFWPLRWHPRFVFVARPVWCFAFVLHASPLCGAAPTFLCRRKEK